MCGRLVLLVGAKVAPQSREEAHVATVHGAGFGLSPHLRLSYATSEEAIRSACQRMAAAVAKLTSVERK